jgi:prophage DNA circulation protein
VTWREDLRRVRHPDGRELIGASFRGVPFFVESASRTGGRRTVTHEFPGRDEPVIDDLGRRARSFPVEGYVIGDDYLRYRDDLLSALEDVAGPGALVHPYYGNRRAICTGLTVQETIADGGMARFSIEFTEAPLQVLAPTEEPDLAGDVEASADAALEAVEDELVATFDVDGQPAFAIESLGAELAAVGAAMGEGLSPLVTSTQELARLNVEIQSIASDATSIVRAPANAIAALVDVLGGLAETIAESPRAVLLALMDAYGTASEALAAGDTATRELERANQAALSAALRRVMAIEAARLLPLVEYESHEDAVSDRDAVAEALEEQAETAGDTSYPALVQLRSDVLRAIPRDELARIVTLDLRVATPSILLSYQFYGTTTWEANVVERNQAQHPGFLSGEIRVVSRG